MSCLYGPKLSCSHNYLSLFSFLSPGHQPGIEPSPLHPTFTSWQYSSYLSPLPLGQLELWSTLDVGLCSRFQWWPWISLIPVSLFFLLPVKMHSYVKIVIWAASPHWPWVTGSELFFSDGEHVCWRHLSLPEWSQLVRIQASLMSVRLSRKS